MGYAADLLSSQRSGNCQPGAEDVSMSRPESGRGAGVGADSVTPGRLRSRVPSDPSSLFLAVMVLAALSWSVELRGASPGDEGFLVGNGKAANPNLPSQQLQAQESRPSRTGPASLQQETRESAATSEGPVQGQASPPSTRQPLSQSQCTICLTGSSTVQWSGNSGSFHVDHVANYKGTSTGSMDLRIILVSNLPVWGQTINYWSFSDPYALSPLPAGYQYTNVNSGTVSFYPASIPAGMYWALLYLREYVGGTWYYADWMTYSDKVWCNGSSCSTVSTCVENSSTMCLIGGRYRVTSQWTNQYAGGAVSTLNKTTLTDATGAFWLSDGSTYEYVIRINTATNNGRAWVAILTFTDVEFSVLVEDLFGGQSKTYHSLPGNRTLIYDPLFFVYP